MSKYLGKLQVTYEMIAKLLMINEKLKFVDTYTDPNRQVVHFIFESDKPVRGTNGETWLVGEAHEVPTFCYEAESYIEGMKEFIAKYEKDVEIARREEGINELRRLIEGAKRDA